MLDYSQAEWIRSGIQNTRFRFFAERWAELLDPGGCVGHRVRAVNLRLLLAEWLEALEQAERGNHWAWQDAAVIASELLGSPQPPVEGLLDFDPMIREGYRDQRAQVETAAKMVVSGKEPRLRLIGQARASARQLHDLLEQNGVQASIDAIRQAVIEAESAEVSSKKLERISRLTASLAADCLGKGYSRQYLEIIGEKWLSPADESADGYTCEERYGLFADAITSPATESRVMMAIPDGPRHLDGTTWPSNLSFNTGVKPANDDERMYIQAQEHSVFVVQSGMAMDHWAAARTAAETVQNVFDVFSFLTGADISPLADIAVATVGDQALRVDLTREDFMCGNAVNRRHIRGLVEAVAGRTIDQSADLMEHISHSLRYYRLGVSSNHKDNAFLNMWIGLEFLTRTPNSENTSDSVFQFLPAVWALGMMRRRLWALQHLTVDEDAARISEILNEDFASMSPEALYSHACNVDLGARMLSALSESPLARYRMEQACTLCQDYGRFKQALTLSYQLAKWQLHRIYRLRNAIVHSARHSLPLLHVYPHLQEYLQYMLARGLDALVGERQPGQLCEAYWGSVVMYERLIKRNTNEGFSAADIAALLEAPPE